MDASSPQRHREYAAGFGHAARGAVRPGDTTHPLGYGRVGYIWSMFATFGLFAIGAAVSAVSACLVLRRGGRYWD